MKAKAQVQKTTGLLVVAAMLAGVPTVLASASTTDTTADFTYTQSATTVPTTGGTVTLTASVPGNLSYRGFNFSINCEEAVTKYGCKATLESLLGEDDDCEVTKAKYKGEANMPSYFVYCYDALKFPAERSVYECTLEVPAGLAAGTKINILANQNMGISGLDNDGKLTTFLDQTTSSKYANDDYVVWSVKVGDQQSTDTPTTDDKDKPTTDDKTNSGTSGGGGGSKTSSGSKTNNTPATSDTPVTSSTPEPNTSSEPSSTPKAEGNPFADVAKSDYYYDAVQWANENGVAYGTDATHFSPKSNAVRAQLVTFLWRASGSPEPTSTQNPFVDVPANSYYYKAVLWGYENGYVSGTSKDTFSPNAKVTRGQAVTFLARMAGADGNAAGHPFTDVSADAYYNNAVAYAYNNKIAAGTTATTFSPNGDCTRGQIVTFLYHYFVK